jgi:hypothetical protein
MIILVTDGPLLHFAFFLHLSLLARDFVLDATVASQPETGQEVPK